MKNSKWGRNAFKREEVVSVVFQNPLNVCKDGARKQTQPPEKLCSVIRAQTGESTWLFQFPDLSLVPIVEQHTQTPSPHVLIHRLQPTHMLTSTFSIYEAV